MYAYRQDCYEDMPHGHMPNANTSRVAEAPFINMHVSKRGFHLVGLSPPYQKPSRWRVIYSPSTQSVQYSIRTNLWRLHTE